MSTTSLSFLGFVIVAALLFNLSAAPAWRRGVFFIANLGFLGSFASDGVSLLPLAGFLAFGWGSTRLLGRGRAKTWFWPLLGLVLAGFFWLKKYSFVPEALWLDRPYTTIGLSYVFFRVVQVMIDARDGSLTERLGPIDYINYALNFTTLISGPIQRFQEFAAQQRPGGEAPLGWITAGRAVERIAIGYFKIIVMAALLSAAHGQALAALSAAQPASERVAAALVATVGYTFYLYFNFSGYTDIVIGVARFFRLELPENFDRPFSATSFMEFWGRWHITLSDWLKTYVYNPLVKALMVRFPSPAIEPFLGVAAFFVTFFLIGLWHGQTPVFALYGFLLGLGVSGNKLHQILMIRRFGRKRYKALAAALPYRAMARGLTFTWFTFSLVCFWASWGQIVGLCRALGWSGVALWAVLLWFSASLLLAAAEGLRSGVLALSLDGRPVVLSRYVRTVWATAIAATAAAAVALMTAPAPDIVYKNF